MSSLNLPVLAEVKKVEEKLPEISSEPIAPEITQEEIFVDKQETVVNTESQMEIKPVKPKRKLSEKQIAHLAKMRENRQAKRKAKQDSMPSPVNDVRSPTIAPRKDGPAKKAEPPANTPKPDNFYQFMDYMEKYKSIKKSWRERDAEKRASKPAPAARPAPAAAPAAAARAAPTPPAAAARATPKTQVKKPTTNILNVGKKHNPYSSYF